MEEPSSDTYAGFAALGQNSRLSHYDRKRDSVGCEVRPWAQSSGVRAEAELAATQKAGSSLSASASSLSRQPCAASSLHGKSRTSW